MAAPRSGLVVLVRFPFSDLSASKLRPAVVLAAAGGVDWVLRQVTSIAYGDLLAVPLHASDFEAGGLHRESFARPSKLFTAAESIFVRAAGRLTPGGHRALVEAVVRVLESGAR